MNKIYDNGEMLLGRKKDIEQHCMKLIIKNDDEEIKESAKEIIEEIKEYNDNDILCINYDFGMGILIKHWEDKDEVIE